MEINIGTRVFVHPTRSLKFAGRWGTVVNMDSEDLMPVRVKMPNWKTPLRFSADELMTIKDYVQWLVDSEEVMHMELKKRLAIKEVKIPMIITDGGMYPFDELAPITKCSTCGVDTTGQFTLTCEDCLNPVFNGEEEK